MTKKLISIITSIIMCIGCFSISVSAKVIEPEIVKTEKWTTSYYIDDDIETLYPYIQCEADIYNDGTIKLYMWNTHEWDGFATVSHTATIVDTVPFIQDSRIYAFWKNDTQFGKTHAEYVDSNGGERIYVPSTENIYNRRQEYPTTLVTPTDESNPYIKLNLSYYSSKYSISGNTTQYIGKQQWCSNGGWETLYYAWRYSSSDTWFYAYEECYLYATYRGALPNMSFYTDSTDARKASTPITLKPTEDPTGTYNFRLFGHDITITPELLSGNIVAEPELTDHEKRTNELETKVSNLEKQLEAYQAFDFDSDNLLTAADAQMILTYYVEYLAGVNDGSVSGYADFVKLFRGE